MQKKGKEKSKKVAITILVTFLFLIEAVAASDVAYIYRKEYRIDKNILDVFDELGLSYDLINENKLPIDFSEYRFIFIGDENLRKPHLIPLDNKAAVIANYYHGEDFGLTDFDGISKLGSTKPLEVNKDGQIIQVYTKERYSIGSNAIPYYYLDNENKEDNLVRVASTWVGTRRTGASSQFGDVISYAYPGTILINGKRVTENICFYGIIESDYWTPAAKELFVDCLKFVSLVCKEDSDCGGEETGENYCIGNDVYRNVTNYKCVDSEGFYSQCVGDTTQEFVKKCEECENGECVGECSVDSDCGTDYYEENYCKDNNVWRDYHDFSCIDGNCDEDIIPELVEECEECENGECLDIECKKNSDCGENSYVGEKYCFNGNIHRDFISYTCINPGTTESYCESGTSPILTEYCEGSCENGECISCSSDSDCGEDGWAGENYCIGKEIWRDYQEFECVMPGTSESDCSSVVEPRFVQECEECENGECVGECKIDEDCPEKCTKTSHKLYTTKKCNNLICEYSNYECVVGKCGAECDEDSDCGCEEDYCDGTTLVDYPEQGYCGTAGSEGCLCQCEAVYVENATQCTDECSVDSDCGTDYYGENYCKNDDIWTDFHDFSCIIGECKEEIKGEFFDCGEEEYGKWENYCEGNDVRRKRTHYQRGCENGECYENGELEDEKVEECGKCENGECVGECKVDEDCGETEYMNWSYYCDQEDKHRIREVIYKKCLEGECGEEGIWEDEFVEYCGFGCEEGECLNECEVDSDCGETEYMNWSYYCDQEDKHRIREVIYKKCLEGECGEEGIWEDEFVEYCGFGCENGECMGNHNSSNHNSSNNNCDGNYCCICQNSFLNCNFKCDTPGCDFKWNWSC